jgi:ubiquinone/menaquinone biosynthesis C-methylase UbiE
MRPLLSAALVVWRRLVVFGFRLLYNELAWAYDAVSWVVSRGLWHRWQWTVWPQLPPAGQVLEVGSGPGHLLADLATAGYRPAGLDLSPAMLRLARQRLRREGLEVPLCRGQASSLPFAAEAFDAVVVTFPTAFVYDEDWMSQAARVLQTGGRLIVVEMASFSRTGSLSRCLEWLFRITGQRGPAPDLPGLLRAVGLDARRAEADVEGTTVELVLARKGTTDWRD